METITKLASISDFGAHLMINLELKKYSFKDLIITKEELFCLKSIFNESLELSVRKITDSGNLKNPMFFINTSKRLKLFRINSEDHSDVYYSVSGEGSSFILACKDFISSFLRQIGTDELTHEIFFLTHEESSDHKRVFLYNKELFLAIRTDTLRVAN